MKQFILNCIEVALRFAASVLTIILFGNFYNLVKFKSFPLLTFIIGTATILMALELWAGKRRIATSREELESMYTVSKHLGKYNAALFTITIIVFVLGYSIAVSNYTTDMKKYDEINEEVAELFEVTRDAVIVLRCIPGTFPERAFYAITTEPENFDFDFYNSKVKQDYILYGMLVLSAILHTQYCQLRRYNKSVRNIEDANY